MATKPSISDIINFSKELEALCIEHNAKCTFSRYMVRKKYDDLTSLHILTKSQLRSGQFEVVFGEPPLGSPYLVDWAVPYYDVNLYKNNLKEVFFEQLLRKTFSSQ